MIRICKEESCDPEAAVAGAANRVAAPLLDPVGLVDAALPAGIRVPHSCKGGMCCTCRARLVEGRVEMRRNYSLEPWDARGFILTCQAVPLTERVVVDYDSM
jgi:ring-1,2-phenylacetyl-CoA epoxidase subunit PaaE